MFWLFRDAFVCLAAGFGLLVTSVPRSIHAFLPIDQLPMVRAIPSACGAPGLCLWTLALVMLAGSAAWSPQDSADWQQQIREKVRLHQLDAALALVDQRLELNKADPEAHSWRGRLLAWQGHWASAESEYRQVLDQVPTDTEILCGLADVLLWQSKTKEALGVVNRARALDPSQPEILLRRARILLALQNTSEARSQYRELLRIHPENREAKAALAGLVSEDRNELRIGADGSTFNYIGPAEDEEYYITSHWTPRFTTTVNTGYYRRFGESGKEFVARASLRITRSDWMTGGGAFSNHQSIIPQNETFFEYGHGLHFVHPWVKGLEVSYQQHWFWYQGAHVLTLNGTQLYYLPHDWTCTLSLTGARSGFAGTGIEWVPSGYVRLGFPLYRALSGDLTFGSGTENFAQIDQIGHFSARTYSGELKYRISPSQDLRGYVALQDRSAGQTQNSYGLSYGFHF
jgi:Tfp pilus assembly protein PilF